MNDDKPFPTVLHFELEGVDRTVGTVREAYDMLTVHWPEGGRGPRYEDATGACLKVLDGHRSVADAVDALRAVADEAGVPMTD